MRLAAGSCEPVSRPLPSPLLVSQVYSEQRGWLQHVQYVNTFFRRSSCSKIFGADDSEIIPNPLNKATVFPVAMCGCESQTQKKVDCQRTDAFQLWCWRRLLRVPRLTTTVLGLLSFLVLFLIVSQFIVPTSLGEQTYQTLKNKHALN